VFCVYLRTNSDLCHLQHKLSGYYNPDGKYLLRGTDWVFKSSLRLVYDKKCLQRGTDWVFQYSSLSLVYDEKCWERGTDWVFNKAAWA
jgi:hypothetical protein